MTSHKTALYKIIFRELQNLFPAFNPTHIMSDYESGLRRAIKTTLPFTRILGCRFHYAQAIYRKIKGKFRLATYYKNRTASDLHGKISGLLRQYLSLPLLQTQHIRGEVERLERELRDTARRSPAHVGRKLNNFHLYVVNYWMKLVGFNSISVYNCQHKTNNIIERYKIIPKIMRYALTKIASRNFIPATNIRDNLLTSWQYHMNLYKIKTDNLNNTGLKN